MVAKSALDRKFFFPRAPNTVVPGTVITPPSGLSTPSYHLVLVFRITHTCRQVGGTLDFSSAGSRMGRIPVPVSFCWSGDGFEDQRALLPRTRFRNSSGAIVEARSWRSFLRCELHCQLSSSVVGPSCDGKLGRHTNQSDECVEIVVFGSDSLNDVPGFCEFGTLFGFKTVEW